MRGLKEVDCETLWITARIDDCGICAVGMCCIGDSPERHGLRHQRHAFQKGSRQARG
ncbi:hypothetical protein MESS2_1240004 [Mesorhizobium metallidurans STM 2683]|uniref:Uncharacterized protein n=1 Tax=Mesorhizobium metallidurans STM 2683 TaxID=1297569 RepID=M5EX71_9HYPH|nr:hypothetical protein MESS2_1240004 [Mesorhizobium metallidurans STM 2683]